MFPQPKRFPWLYIRREPGELEFYFPAHDRPGFRFTLPGYVAPDEYTYRRSQKVVQLADGTVAVYSGAGKWAEKTLILRVSDEERNQVATLIELADFCAKTFEVRAPHWQSVWVCRLARPEFSETLIVPGHWEIRLQVRVEDARPYNPNLIVIRPRDVAEITKKVV